MKTIVCYGDSNTWGADPARPGDRIPLAQRYTGILQELLGSGYRIMEEGLNGRTTAFEDPIEPHRNGAAYIECVMLSHKPVDLLVVMLGTNDLKRHLHQTAFSSSKGLELLVQRAQLKDYGTDGRPPEILLVSPVHVGENIEETWLCEYIDNHGRDMGFQLAGYYMEIARLHGCYFMNAADFAQASPLDAIHLAPEGHRKLAISMAEKIKEIL